MAYGQHEAGHELLDKKKLFDTHTILELNLEEEYKVHTSECHVILPRWNLKSTFMKRSSKFVY
jgi:hypothetical protein